MSLRLPIGNRDFPSDPPTSCTTNHVAEPFRASLSRYMRLLLVVRSQLFSRRFTTTRPLYGRVPTKGFSSHDQSPSFLWSDSRRKRPGSGVAVGPPVMRHF